MKHLKNGMFRAYLDGELNAEESAQFVKHLSNCALCAGKVEELESRSVFVDSKLQQLKISTESMTLESTGQSLRMHLNAIKRQKNQKTLLTPRYRPALASAAVVIIAALLMTLAPVRALANDFLALFRIQRLEFVEFNPLNLPNSEDTIRTAAMEIERLVDEELEIDLHGEPIVVEHNAVPALTSFPVRFPSLVSDYSRITVQPGFDMAMKLDITEIRTLLAALGYQAVELSETLDGAEIHATFEKSVVAAFGRCPSDETGASASEGCNVFIQTPSPNVNAPPELDLQQLGQLYLQLLGMKADQAARFSRTIDWTTTLVVPIPSTEATYKDVQVDGVTGTLVEGRQYNEIALMWVKDDIVYAIIGTGDANMFVNLADSLK